MTDEILRLVPNIEVFRDSLRCIKLWAQREYFLLWSRTLTQTSLSPRTSHLFERERVLGWCCLGYVGRSNMSAVP